MLGGGLRLQSVARPRNNECTRFSEVIVTSECMEYSTGTIAATTAIKTTTSCKTKLHL